MNESASIGIIGGADGPTAVFITGDPTALIVIALVAVAIIGAIIWKLKKK